MSDSSKDCKDIITEPENTEKQADESEISLLSTEGPEIAESSDSSLVKACNGSNPEDKRASFDVNIDESQSSETFESTSNEGAWDKKDFIPRARKRKASMPQKVQGSFSEGVKQKRMDEQEGSVVSPKFHDHPRQFATEPRNFKPFVQPIFSARELSSPTKSFGSRSGSFHPPTGVFEEFEKLNKSVTIQRTTPRKRRALTLQTKLDIIKDVDDKIKTKHQILAEYDIPNSTLWTIMKYREKLLGDLRNVSGNYKRLSSSPYSAVEGRLFEWICEVRKVCEEPIKEGTMKAKALEIAHSMGHLNFSASSGWLYRFKQRYKDSLSKCSPTGNESPEAADWTESESTDYDLSNHSRPCLKEFSNSRDSSDNGQTSRDSFSEDLEWYRKTMGNHADGIKSLPKPSLEDSKDDEVCVDEDGQTKDGNTYSELPGSSSNHKSTDGEMISPKDTESDPVHSELERQLYRWICQVKGSESSPISDDLIRAKAYELAQGMSNFSFCPNGLWVAGFKRRYSYNVSNEDTTSRDEGSAFSDDDGYEEDGVTSIESEKHQPDSRQANLLGSTNGVFPTHPGLDFQSYLAASNIALQSLGEVSYDDVAQNVASVTKAFIEEAMKYQSTVASGKVKMVPPFVPQLPGNMQEMPNFFLREFARNSISSDTPSQCKGVRKRNDLTLKTKIEILQLVDEGRMKRSQIAAKFGIPKSSLTSILKFREKILRDWSSSNSEDSRRARITPFQEIEKELFKWICDVRATYDGPIKDTVMKAKALELAQKMGHESFSASSGWIYKFKQRMGIPVVSRRSLNPDDQSSNGSFTLGQKSDEAEDDFPVSSTTVHSSQIVDTELNSFTSEFRANCDSDSTNDSLSGHSLKNLKALWGDDSKEVTNGDAQTILGQDSLECHPNDSVSKESASCMDEGHTNITGSSVGVSLSLEEQNNLMKKFWMVDNEERRDSLTDSSTEANWPQPGTSSNSHLTGITSPYMPIANGPPKRRALSLETKIDMLQCIDAKIKPRAQIAADFGISANTLNSILKHREKLMGDWARKVPGNCKRIQESRYKDMEKELYAWICETERTTGRLVRGGQIKAKALELAGKDNQPAFSASNGWLCRFRQRFQFPVKSNNCISCKQPRNLCQCC